jgi:hypothetical protein
MSLQVQVSCDVCGRQKREVNHWWVLHPSRLARTHGMPKWLRTSVMPWDEEEAAAPNALHICGQACMLKAIERFMQGHEVERELPKTERCLESSAAVGCESPLGYQN